MSISIVSRGRIGTISETIVIREQFTEIQPLISDIVRVGTSIKVDTNVDTEIELIDVIESDIEIGDIIDTVIEVEEEVD